MWTKVDKVCFLFGQITKMYVKCKMSKTLSRERHSGNKSYVSETVIEICRGENHNFFSELLLLPFKSYGIFLSQQSLATVGLVEISTLLDNNKWKYEMNSRNLSIYFEIL